MKVPYTGVCTGVVCPFGRGVVKASRKYDGEPADLGVLKAGDVRLGALGVEEGLGRHQSVYL